MPAGLRTIVARLSCLRWVWFGAVVYATLFVILKRNLKSESNIGDLYHICQSPEMIQEICSCHQNEPFAHPEKRASLSSRLTYLTTTTPENQSWKQKGKKALKTFGHRNVQLQQRKMTKPSEGEQRHIAFVKTHKAASSTVLNILYRFARDRDLVVLLPKNGNYLEGRFLNKTSLLPPPEGKTYDILCNHAIFNHTSFSTFLPSDTVYIGIVREPFARLISAFYYYRYEITKPYLKAVPGHYLETLKNYLKTPSQWEPKNPLASMTNNRMAVDFGYPPEQFQNESHFDEYLLKLDSIFRVVLVAERFDESLVLMKRALNWTIKDIVYTVKNRARIKKFPRDDIEKLKPNFQNYSHLDNKLYGFFLKRLDENIEQEGRLFKEEVTYFRRVKDNIATFCTYNRHLRHIDIPRSNWTKGFSFNKRECRYLRLEELSFLYYVRSQQQMDFQRWGMNAKFMKSLP